MTAQPMTLEAAHEILKGLYRHVLADHAFGDAEVWWTKEKNPASPPIAGGYKSNSGTSVTIDAYNGHAAGSFAGDEARKLIYRGLHGSRTRNDETGDDYHRPL